MARRASVRRFIGNILWPTSRCSTYSKTMHLLEFWDHLLVERFQWYDRQMIERSKADFEREFLDQMRVVSVNNPHERVLKRRVILTEHVVDSVFR